jgi:hypothetical protein
VKPFLRFVKLCIGFFLIMAGSYLGWVSNHSNAIANKDAPTLVSIILIAAGLTIFWIDYRLS